jgi:hypothetical protein
VWKRFGKMTKQEGMLCHAMKVAQYQSGAEAIGDVRLTVQVNLLRWRALLSIAVGENKE